jgi:multiple sugar transport system permease protein
MIFPFIWMLSTSLKETTEVFSFPPQLIPETFMFSNFIRVWELLPFGRAFLNSLTIALIVVFFQLFTGAMAAYAFAKLNFKGKNILFIIILSTIMIPEQVTVIPLFLMFNEFNWIDTHAAVIMPFAFVYPFGIFLLRQFMMGVPQELKEAAIMDGCNPPRIFFRIVIPLCKSAIFALMIFSFISIWNSFLYPLIFLHSMDNFTLPLMLSMFQGHWFTDWTLLMAAAATAVIPSLIVYLFAQKQIIEGIAITGLK